MNFQNKLLATVAILSFSTVSAFASLSGVGNGGVSVVCRDSGDRITSAQLLDIYEGKVRHGKKYDNQLDVDTKVELAQLKLINYPSFLSAFQEELANVKAMMVYIPIGNELTPTNDAFPTVLKKGCEFEQVANYTEDGDLLVSQEIFNELATVDRAALLVHEVVYALLRKNGATDSRQARRLTAELLAKNVDQKVIEEVLQGSGGSLTKTCGMKGSVEERIQDCNKKNGLFALVTTTKEGHEVYKDLRSGLLWSERLPLQMSHYDAEKACKSELAELVKLSEFTWKLPSIYEYKEAERNGIRKALTNMKYWFWSSSLVGPNHDHAWLLYGRYGNDGIFNRNDNYSVRCVAW
jgi:hypothetical protein